MTAQIHSMPGTTLPEYLAPSLAPAVGGPIQDARMDINDMIDDMREGMRWATAQKVPVLSMACDRNGAYLVVAPVKHIYTLFGAECGQWRRHVENGLTTEHWLGCIGHIRVFWREVKCCAH